MSELLSHDQLPLNIIDQAVPDRPVIVLDDLGHGAWLNSSAMEAVGYDTLQGDPPGGILVRDPDTGDLTGVVLENAQQAVRTAAIPPIVENLDFAYDGLLEVMDILGENGITSISDAGGYWTRGHHTVWQRAETEETLTVRASNAYYIFPDMDYDEQMAELETLFSDSEDSLLRFNQAKIYVDGILSQGTGALLSPYNQSFELPGVPNDGFLYFDVETLNDYSADLAEIGYQLHYHVTGDRGARLALNAIEAAQAGDLSARHRLTHLYLVDGADRPRFAELGVVGDWQLSPDATSDEYYAFMQPFLGGRADELLPAFSPQFQNATISSDWDADEVSPFRKISSLLSLQWDNVPELDTILQMMTLNVAYLLHQDDITGSIEVGKLADLIVLDQNLFEVSPAQIERTKVLWTLLEGEEVYRDNSFNN
jgi:predicted amidohydrolase YtcJ